MEGRIFDIQRFSIDNGPGIRTTVFFKGCPLKCIWCHNPEGQRTESEMLYDETTLDGHFFMRDRLAGREISSDELLKEIIRDKPFFQRSNGGVTFSGGEPLMQSDFLLDILEKCKYEEIHTAIDTCGYASPEIFEKATKLANLVLFDLKIANPDEHFLYTGKENKLILDNLCALNSINTEVVFRVPLISEINAKRERIKEIIEWLYFYQRKVKQLIIVPYHSFARSKYKSLNRMTQFFEFNKISEKDLEMAKELFEFEGIKIINNPKNDYRTNKKN